MIIDLWDSWSGKFSSDMKKHWEELGHEVRFNGLKYDPEIPADIAFWYQADNASQVGILKSNAKKKFVQCVDIEVYAGQPFAVDWTKVDGCMFMAKHIRDYVLSKQQFPQNVRLLLTKPGVDIDKWTLNKSPKSTPVKKIAYVVGDHRIWDVKRLDTAFQLLYDLNRAGQPWIYQLHIRGTYSSHVQYNTYCQYLEKDLGLEGFVVWYPDRVGDMNGWLNDKDYFLLPSTKEAFSYATAEAMCKGIKPIINNWEGSKDTWGGFVSNSYGEMMQHFLEDKYEPEKYRQYIIDNYDIKRYMKEVDEFLEIGGDE